MFVESATQVVEGCVKGVIVRRDAARASSIRLGSVQKGVETVSVLSKVVTGIALAGVVAMATSAQADGMRRGSIKDAPYVAPFSWTGFYAGVNAGYAWGDSSSSSSMSCPTGGCPWNNPANLAAFSSAGTGSLDPDGFTGGVQAGYNLQSGNIVMGVEVDFNAFSLDGSRTVTAPVPTLPGLFTASTGIATDWLMTARARLGMAVSPNVLIYVTGGLALTDVEVSNGFSDTALAPASAGASSSSKLKTGWALGGGMEMALNRNWTVRGEYLYVDFGSVSTTALVNNVPNVGNNNNLFSTSADLNAHIARVGLNYKF